MAKAVVTKIKLQIPGGQATPAPPVGPALGQHGVNIGQFVTQFNEKSKDSQGVITPVEITVYKDKSFSFIMKSPPASVLLKRAAGIAKGSPTPNREKIGKVTKSQIEEIAKAKLSDLNAKSVDMAVKIIEGTAQTMGITVEG
jgi:large subunit ribosomal protein L11